MLHKNTFEFLRKLDKNNNREWFADHKSLYDEARQDVENLASELIPAVAEFDEEISDVNPKKCMFRIYRDTRFSPDKRPYKTNFGVILRPSMQTGKYSGYYIHIDPCGCFLSSGLYMLSPNLIKRVRCFIYDDLDSFKEIISEKQLVKETGGLRFDPDEMLKRVPAGFDSEHPAAEYMKLKHFYVMKTLDEADLTSSNFTSTAVNTFRTMYPFGKYLNEIVNIF